MVMVMFFSVMQPVNDDCYYPACSTSLIPRHRGEEREHNDYTAGDVDDQNGVGSVSLAALGLCPRERRRHFKPPPCSFLLLSLSLSLSLSLTRSLSLSLSLSLS